MTLFGISVLVFSFGNSILPQYSAFSTKNERKTSPLIDDTSLLYFSVILLSMSLFGVYRKAVLTRNDNFRFLLQKYQIKEFLKYVAAY